MSWTFLDNCTFTKGTANIDFCISVFKGPLRVRPPLPPPPLVLKNLQTFRAACVLLIARLESSRRRLWCSRSFAYDGLRGAALSVVSSFDQPQSPKKFNQRKLRDFLDPIARIVSPAHERPRDFSGILGLSRSGVAIG